MVWQLVTIALLLLLRPPQTDAGGVLSSTKQRIIVHCVYDTEPQSVGDNAALLDEAVRMLADAFGSTIVIVAQEDVDADVDPALCRDDPARVYLINHGVPPSRIRVAVERDEAALAACATVSRSPSCSRSLR